MLPNLGVLAWCVKIVPVRRSDVDEFQGLVTRCSYREDKTSKSFSAMYVVVLSAS